VFQVIVALEVLGYKVFVALFPVLPNTSAHGGHKPGAAKDDAGKALPQAQLQAQ